MLESPEPPTESLIGARFDVLDKGFVRVVDLMGDDAAVVQAARVSYGEGTRSVREDRSLLRYLIKHWHTSPFEMCEIKLHIRAPIFIARQWLRHRTANVNECSARYSVVRDDFYEPLPEAVAVQSESNNQGRGKTLPEDQALAVVASLMRQAKESYSLYEELLEPSTGNGVARELARVALPLSTYTEFYWKIDLHNFLHFLRLRADAHAQYEIRAYADVLMTILRMWVPLTHEAFIDYRMDAKQFSRMELEALKRLLRGDTVVPRDLGLTPREWREFQDVLDLAGKSVSGGHPVGLYAAE